MGANIFGIDIGDMVGRTVREVRGDEIYAVMKPHIDAALRGEAVSFEGETLMEGIRYHYQSSFVPDRDADGKVQGLYALTFDISRLKQAEEALERLARIDSLTGVANRRQFEEQLASALARARRQDEGIALLAIDVDHFKTSTTTTAIRSATRCWSRWRAGCWPACAPATWSRAWAATSSWCWWSTRRRKAPKTIAQHVMAAIREPVELGPHMKLPIGASIGVAYSSSAIEAQALMSLADRALYRAKAAGRNCWRSASSDEVAAPRKMGQILIQVRQPEPE
jgi:GGDEF domain-containing protein